MGPPVGSLETSKIRVVLADDDASYLESLCVLIDRQPELAVVGSAQDGLATIELVEQLGHDEVVIDLHMPLLDGVPEPALHKAVAEAGADAVLLKDEMVEHLVERLSAVRGRIAMN